MKKVISLLIVTLITYSTNASGTRMYVGSFKNMQERIIKKSQASIENIISANITGTELKQIIENAKEGTLIYINDDVVIEVGDLGTNSIIISKSIVIASGRAHINNENSVSKGALIKRGGIVGAPPLFLIKSEAKSVRIAGLRFEGNRDLVGQKFVTIKSMGKVCIENCEIYNWSSKAIESWPEQKAPTLNLVVAYNYIHDNTFKPDPKHGTGYGISVVTGHAIIFGNWFGSNRHAIAGSGLPNCSYEAYHNYFDSGSTRHDVDMHGISDHNSKSEIDYWNKYWNYKEDKVKNVAGMFISVHHNAFGRHTGNGGNHIKIRGCPIKRSAIRANKFHHAPQISIVSNCSIFIKGDKNLKGKINESEMIIPFGIYVRTQTFRASDYPPKWNMQSKV